MGNLFGPNVGYQRASSRIFMENLLLEKKRATGPPVTDELKWNRKIAFLAPDGTVFFRTLDEIHPKKSDGTRRIAL